MDKNLIKKLREAFIAKVMACDHVFSKFHSFSYYCSTSQSIDIKPFIVKVSIMKRNEIYLQTQNQEVVAPALIESD